MLRGLAPLRYGVLPTNNINIVRLSLPLTCYIKLHSYTKDNRSPAAARCNALYGLAVIIQQGDSVVIFAGT
jgi:hypothetical protein